MYAFYHSLFIVLRVRILCFFVTALGKPQPIISEELANEQSNKGETKGKPRLQTNRSTNENNMSKNFNLTPTFNAHHEFLTYN